MYYASCAPHYVLLLTQHVLICRWSVLLSASPTCTYCCPRARGYLSPGVACCPCLQSSPWSTLQKGRCIQVISVVAHVVESTCAATLLTFSRPPVPSVLVHVVEPFAECACLQYGTQVLNVLARALLRPRVRCTVLLSWLRSQYREVFKASFS